MGSRVPMAGDNVGSPKAAQPCHLLLVTLPHRPFCLCRRGHRLHCLAQHLHGRLRVELGGLHGGVAEYPRDEGKVDTFLVEVGRTQATQLLGAGVDLKTVQARMGHAKASHTLDLYAHAIPANDRDAANIMGSLYNAPAQAAGAAALDKSA